MAGKLVELPRYASVQINHTKNMFLPNQNSRS